MKAKRYDVLFIDLDDTLYDFTTNSTNAYREVYALMDYDRWFDDFDHYYRLYWERNRELWVLYGDNKITKEQLNAERYTYPLHAMGVPDADAVGARFWEESMKRLPLGKQLMPHAREVLEYLRPRYKMYILSNGFSELQARKMQSAGIGHYFDGVVLSDDIGVNKPHRAIFEHALCVAGVTADRALMIGDNYEVDAKGAYGAGIDQVLYNTAGIELEPDQWRPTYLISSLLELKDII
jgi:putative hydrolase of the HAD superfamily